jgi:hypothetical protein
LFLDCCLISPSSTFGLLSPKTFYIHWLSNILVLRVCYSRNTSCTINLISKFLLSTHRIWKYIIQRIFKVHCIFFGLFIFILLFTLLYSWLNNIILIYTSNILLKYYCDIHVEFVSFPKNIQCTLNIRWIIYFHIRCVDNKNLNDYCLFQIMNEKRLQGGDYSFRTGQTYEIWNENKLARSFSFTFRYIDDILSLNNLKSPL